MTLWLILTVMTSAAAVWLAVPLIRRFDHPHGDTAGDIEVYRDQLAEVERELRDAQIDEAQAETARIEVKRRILAAGRPQPSALPALSGRERSFALVSATAIVVLGSTILYAVTGRPDLPSARPAAGRSRLAAVPRGGQSTLPPQHPSLDDFAATEQSDGEGAGMQASLPTVEEMTRRLAERLAQKPGDPEGWRTLGWSYLNIGRFEEAAQAYAKATALDPGNTEFRIGRIEGLVGAAGGVVTPEAKAAVAEVLKLDPKDARARYFVGLSREQEGDKAAALDIWSDLLKEAGSAGHSDDSWASDLKSKVSALRQEMGLDGGTAPPSVTAEKTPESSGTQSAASPSPSVDKGPSFRDVQAAEAMAPADRSAMIRGMVDGLASRLEQSPRDADGWIKLIRSRVVLGEGELARQALARALAEFADDASERERIAATAQQLGLKP